MRELERVRAERGPMQRADAAGEECGVLHLAEGAGGTPDRPSPSQARRSGALGTASRRPRIRLDGCTKKSWRRSFLGSEVAERVLLRDVGGSGPPPERCVAPLSPPPSPDDGL
eukprot:7542311-Alexandrium_andersonii.AAC.1